MHGPRSRRANQCVLLCKDVVTDPEDGCLVCHHIAHSLIVTMAFGFGGGGGSAPAGGSAMTPQLQAAEAEVCIFDRS